MSKPLTPYDRWDSGTNQNSIPANDNSLRDEIFNTDGIADDVTAQPGSPEDGDWYIIPNGATGTQWATFAEDSVAIFYGGTWYEFVPEEGSIVTVARGFYIYGGSAGWEVVTLPSAAEWGLISGTLADQTDLQSALDAKASPVVDVITPTNSGGTVTLDFDGNSKYIGAITLGANVTTLAVSNLPGAGKYAEYELHIEQDPTTPRTFAIPASHKALGGSDTAISASVGVTTVLTASTIDNGTTWRYAMQESA